MKIFKKLILPIVMVVASVVNLALIISLYIYIQAVTHENINECTNSTINDFNVKICTYRANNREVDITTYDFNQKRVIILSANNSYDSNQTKFITKVLKESIGEPKKVKAIKIVAHSNIAENSDSLAKKRALKLKNIISKIGYSRNTISTKYNKEPFLNEIDMKLNGTLLRVLELHSDVVELKNELNISKGRKIKKELLDKYRDRLEPYSSSVILVSFK